jgi:hypothetical protein
VNRCDCVQQCEDIASDARVLIGEGAERVRVGLVRGWCVHGGVHAW